MSLLLAEGHPLARRYPLAVVWSEARMVRQRQNYRAVQDALLVQSVLMSLPIIGGKRGGRELKKVLDKVKTSD